MFTGMRIKEAAALLKHWNDAVHGIFTGMRVTGMMLTGMMEEAANDTTGGKCDLQGHCMIIYHQVVWLIEFQAQKSSSASTH